MGIENRNESTERPEQVEQFREQESRKGEEFKKKLGSSSDYSEIDADKTEFSKALEDKKKKNEAVRVEDISDPEKSSDKSIEAIRDEKTTETPDEGNNVLCEGVEAESIAESNKLGIIGASTPESPEQLLRDQSSGNDLGTIESEFNNTVDNERVNTNGTYIDTAEDREEHTGDTKNVEHHNNSEVLNSESVVIEQKITYPNTYKEYLDSMPMGQKETHKDISDICNSFAEKHLTKEDEAKLGNGKRISIDLPENDKKCLSEQINSKLDKTLNQTPDNLDNCRNYTKESIKGVQVSPDGKAEVIQDWDRGGHSDGAVSGTRTMEVTQKDATIDRIGHPYSGYACPLKEDGTPYSDTERAIGFKSQTPNIEDNACYHKYVVLKDLSRENIRTAIVEKYNLSEKISSWDENFWDESYKLNDYIIHDHQNKCDREYYICTEDGYTGINYLSALDFYYQDCIDSTSNDHVGDVYSTCVYDQEINGIKKGVIAEKFGNDGGGVQYVFPFDISTMCELGLIKEL